MSIGIVEVCMILSIDVQVSKLDGTRLFFRNEYHHVENGYKGILGMVAPWGETIAPAFRTETRRIGGRERPPTRPSTDDTRH